MQDKSLKKNISILLLLKPLSMVLSYVYIPIVLNFLGEEKYGVWVTLLSIISWVNYFDIGIGNGVRNKVTECVAANDRNRATEIISTGYLATTIISIAFFVVFSAIFIGFDLASYFNLNVGRENSTIIVIISVAFICLNFIFALAKSIAYALQQPTKVSLSGVLVQVFNIAIVFILSKTTDASLMAVAIMYGVTAVLGNLILDIYLMKKYPYVIPHKSKIRLSEMKSIATLGIMFFTMQICSLVLNTTDNLLISRFFGAADVTPYSTVNKLFRIIMQLHIIILTPMWSLYTEAKVRGDLPWMKKQLTRLSLLTGAFSVGAVVLIFIFRPLANLWLGRELNYSDSLIVFTAMFTILDIFANVFNCFLSGVGYVKIPAIFAVIQAIINIPLSIIFAVNMNMGLSGIILGSVISVAIPAIVDPLATLHWFKLNRNIKKVEAE